MEEEQDLGLGGRVIDGKYELDKLLGRGGMGEVWRGLHRLTGRRVAIKFLLDPNEDMRKRFLNEALAMGRLLHPNVIDVYDVGQSDEMTYIVMEYLVGRPLTAFIVDGGIEPAKAVEYLMPALAGMAAAHQARLMHRDLKPDNLFVLCDESGEPYDTKVLDFGIAKTADLDSFRLTMTGTFVGTPFYIAPETIAENPSQDERADIWALGIILYELLTGRTPYEARSFQTLLLEVMTKTIPSPRKFTPDLPEGLADVVLKALARDKEERFQTVEELGLALEPWGDGVQFTKPRGSAVSTGAPSLPEVLAGALPWDDAPASGPESDSANAQTMHSTPAPGSDDAQPKREDTARGHATVQLGKSNDGDDDAPIDVSAELRLPIRGRSPAVLWGGLAVAGLVTVGAVGWFALSGPEETPTEHLVPVVEPPGAPVEPEPIAEATPAEAEAAPDPPEPTAVADGVDPPAVEPARQEARTERPRHPTAPVSEDPAPPTQPRVGSTPGADQPIDPFAL